jgi:hypothetical protein
MSGVTGRNRFSTDNNTEVIKKRNDFLAVVDGLFVCLFVC